MSPRLFGTMACVLCNQPAEEDPAVTNTLVARRLEDAGFAVWHVHIECLRRVAHPDSALVRDEEDDD